MHPAGLVDAAVHAGLGALAVCDHNSAENVGAAQRAGRARGLAVLPGMEITSEEEVHVIGLFPDLESALAMQARVYKHLAGSNVPDAFGMQVVADEDAQVLGFNERLLSGATSLSVDRVVDSIHEFNGLAIASHVDRERFGIIGQLGMIPPGLGLDGLEVSKHTPLPTARRAYAPKGDYPLLCNSDAHHPKDVGCVLTYMLLEAPSQTEVRMALANRDGRTILGGGRPMEDLAQHVLDIAQNSIEAGATQIEVDLLEDPEADRLVITVRDNGPGMSPETRISVTDPFFTTRKTRRVGLGIPLLKQAAEATGGALTIESEHGKGTCIRAVFGYRHVDRAPVGDIETTILVLLAGHPDLAIRFRHGVACDVFELDSEDLRSAGIDPATPEGLAALRMAIREGEAGLPERK